MASSDVPAQATNHVVKHKAINCGFRSEYCYLVFELVKSTPTAGVQYPAIGSTVVSIGRPSEILGSVRTEAYVNNISTVVLILQTRMIRPTVSSPESPLRESSHSTYSLIAFFVSSSVSA